MDCQETFNDKEAQHNNIEKENTINSKTTPTWLSFLKENKHKSWDAKKMSLEFKLLKESLNHNSSSFPFSSIPVPIMSPKNEEKKENGQNKKMVFKKKNIHHNSSNNLRSLKMTITSELGQQKTIVLGSPKYSSGYKKPPTLDHPQQEQQQKKLSSIQIEKIRQASEILLSLRFGNW